MYTQTDYSRFVQKYRDYFKPCIRVFDTNEYVCIGRNCYGMGTTPMQAYQSWEEATQCAY